MKFFKEPDWKRLASKWSDHYVSMIDERNEARYWARYYKRKYDESHYLVKIRQQRIEVLNSMIWRDNK